ncbi:MAG: 30S ribosomal protein S8 [Candidatus Moranbacteria bacterium]|nr:30S ribosomal protein S8 [Candidatus Moranbacteria bacterium]
MLDPISDMLTRIRNASRAGHGEVLMPLSKLKFKIAEILKEKNFVEKAEEAEIDGYKQIRISLKYIRNEKGEKMPYIQGLQRVSREGQRIYSGKDKLPIVRNGYGFAIVSTSRGLMTGDEAKKAGIGGEIICEIW